ncbi:MAG: hypothetical protein PHQ00_07185 [Phycisphaerae bacterium]|jgi:hypothetical protein|nr:hypothetical protein [Phycisphaerae bacterium]
MPWHIVCVVCEGQDEECPICKGSGKLAVTECPLVFIGREIWETIRLAELWEKGLSPVDGGVMRQSKSFVEAAEYVFCEKNYWKSKLGIWW